MSRKKTEINPKRADNVKKLLEREGITQKELGKRIGHTQQNVCNIINMKTALTEETAGDITRAFPRFRKEWLLGYDEYPTHEEWADAIQNRKDVTADCMWGVIENSLRKQGKSLKFIHRTGEHVDSSQRLRKDCYYSVVDHDGNELKRLSAREMIEFEQKIQEYCDFLTGKYL